METIKLFSLIGLTTQLVVLSMLYSQLNQLRYSHAHDPQSIFDQSCSRVSDSSK